MECRGLEFAGFDPVCNFRFVVCQPHCIKISQRGTWACKGETGSVFSDVVLEDNEWIDYDEKVRQS